MILYEKIDIPSAMVQTRKRKAAGLLLRSTLLMQCLEMLFCIGGAQSRGGYYERKGPLPLRSVYFAIN